jgi:Zn finger protein HypA/HybF involved in hydrogenase expression
MNKTEAMAHMLAFAAPYGGFHLSNKESKRDRKFACTRCGKKIPPGKPDRRCKECRSKELATIEEEAYVAHLESILKEQRDG